MSEIFVNSGEKSENIITPTPFLQGLFVPGIDNSLAVDGFGIVTPWGGGGTARKYRDYGISGDISRQSTQLYDLASSLIPAEGAGITYNWEGLVGPQGIPGRDGLDGIIHIMGLNLPQNSNFLAELPHNIDQINNLGTTANKLIYTSAYTAYRNFVWAKTSIDSSIKTWNESDINEDASFFIIAGDAGIYISTDDGDSWDKDNPDGDTYIQANCTASGGKAIVLGETERASGTIWTTLDYGVNWSEKTVEATEDATERDACTSETLFFNFPHGTTEQNGQTITPTEVYTLETIKFYAKWKYGDPGTCYISLQETTNGLPNGNLLTDRASFTITADKTLKSIAFSTQPELQIGTKYAIVFEAPSGVASSGELHLYGNSSSGSNYTGGDRVWYNGSVWATVPTQDLNFYCWGFSSPTTANVRNIRLGSGGNFLVATAEDGVYLSTDFGDNWTRKTPDSVEDTDWIKGICSSDGTYIIVVSSANAIYRSANSGSSWAAITPAGGDTFSVNDLATSDDGQYMVIVGQNSTDPTKSCYVSTNYGVSWIAKYPLPDLFLSDTESDIDGKYYMYPAETGESESTLESSALGEGNHLLIFSYLSEAGKPGINQLKKDTYDFYTRLNVEAGSKSTSVYWRLSKVSSDGYWGRKIIIDASDEVTGELSDTATSYKLQGTLHSTFSMDTSDRLLLELYANVGESGNPSVVTISMEGSYNSHFTITTATEWTECDISNDGAIIAVSTSDNFFISFDSGATWKEQGMASSAEVWEGLSISGDGTTGLIANTNDNDEFFIGTNTELYSEATWAESALTSAGRAILDDADAPAQATTLGLGTGDSPTWVGATLSGLTATRVLFAGTGGVISDDSGLVWDKINKRLGIKVTPVQTLSIGGETGVDRLDIYVSDSGSGEDNAAKFETQAGAFIFRNITSTNVNSLVSIKGNGTGYGIFQVFNEDDTRRFEIQCYNGNAYMNMAGDVKGALHIQSGGDNFASFYRLSIAGETQPLRVYGYKSGDVLRNLQFGISSDANDTALITGLSNYYFDGNVETAGKLIAGSFASPIDVTTTRQYGVELHYSGNDYDVTGIRSRARLKTTDTTATAQGALLQAANENGIDAGVLNGALIEAIGKSNGNAATIAVMRGALVNTEWGDYDTVTALKTLHVRTHSRNAVGAGSFGTGYGIYIENEAVGGNGQALDAGIYFKGTNLSAGNKAFTYGIDFTGGTYGIADIRLSDSSVINKNGNWGVGTAIPSGKFSVGSAADEDVYFFYDNDNVGDGVNGQSLYVYRRATGNEYFRIYIDQYNRTFLNNLNGHMWIKAASILYLNSDGDRVALNATSAGNITAFELSYEGLTRELEIYGHRSGDAKRSLQIGVGVDVADTASFDGVSNYLFGGNLINLNDTHSDADGGGATAHIFKREDSDGAETACFQFEASHDGVGVEDQLGKGIWSVNTGAGLVEAIRISSANRVGLATANPTARLHLPAGAATASTAPLKFTSGTDLTAPEAGVIEYDGSHFSVTEVIDRRVLSVASDSVTTAVTVANTTTETTVFTASISAAELHAGKVLRVWGCGQASTHDANDTLTIRIKIGGTLLTTLDAIPGQAANDPLHFWNLITIRTTGAGGTIASHGYIMIKDTEVHENDQDVAVDTTGANDITVTFQWDDADAGNTATLDQCFLEVLV